MGSCELWLVPSASAKPAGKAKGPKPEPGAFEIPAFAGEDHAAGAVAAARDLLAEAPPELPLGVGVHTGVSFVGLVGEADAKDFTALGDAVTRPHG